MKIGELARYPQVSTSCIRFYEREGLLDKGCVTRQSNGYRSYHPKAIETLSLICHLKSVGLELAEIQSLIRPGNNSCGGLLAALDAQIEKCTSAIALIQNRLQALEQAKNTCLNTCSLKSSLQTCCPPP